MSRFSGKSTLREQSAQPSSSSKNKSDLDRYLKENYGADSKKKKKSTKEVIRSARKGTSVRIIDTDATGFVPGEDAVEVKELDPDAPIVVAEDEAAAFEYHQTAKNSRKNAGKWVKISERDSTDEKTNGGRDDMSPPRRYSGKGGRSSGAGNRHRSTRYSPEIREGSISPRNPAIESTSPLCNPSSDLSPPRRSTTGLNDSSDLSPPRRSLGPKIEEGGVCRPKTRSQGIRDDKDTSQFREMSNPGQRQQRQRMTDGTSAGILSAQQNNTEINKLRDQDRKRMASLPNDVTGKGAETVYRNRDGRRVTKEERDHDRQKKPKYTWETPQWASGIEQQLNAKRRNADFEKEKAKPFARSRDDEDLDALYRAKLHWDDPMLMTIKKKRTERVSTPVSISNSEESDRRQSSNSEFFVSREPPEHSWKRRRVAPPSNRFGISPGVHWDGVDRSNGFEKDTFKHQNECMAKKKEADGWRMEEM